MTGVYTFTSGCRRSRCSASSSWLTLVPSVRVTRNCGSKAVKRPATRSRKPLKTLRVHTMAIVAMATPATDMPLMMLMAWWLLRLKR